MRDRASEYEQGPDPTSGGFPGSARGGPHGITGSGNPVPVTPGGMPTTPPGRATQSQMLRQALRAFHGTDAAPREADLDEDTDGPTNVYYYAQYTCQLSLSAVTMADHELGLLLPRSGRIWINEKLFTEVPRGRELAQRDAWWRVIDASPAVRFLLAWCVGIYRTAQFDTVPREQLPGWSRVMSFSPALPECSRLRVQFWSDCLQQVTALLAPAPRIWRQIQAFTPIRAGDRRWQARLALANHRVQDVLYFLADRNSCPATLIQRALDGNEPISSYEDYLRVTESLLDDLPRLRMQRVVAMQRPHGQEPPRQLSGGYLISRLPSVLRGHWSTEMEDPRRETSFWSLHL